jgi:hypothetical protein
VPLEDKRLAFSSFFSAPDHPDTTEGTSTGGGDNEFRILLLKRTSNQGLAMKKRLEGGSPCEAVLSVRRRCPRAGIAPDCVTRNTERRDCRPG